MTDDTSAIADLQDRWLAAEVAGDVDALDALAADDLRLVGPFGFVLDKAAWLQRYRGGDLVTNELALEDRRTRVHGELAITIATFRQRAAHRGTDADGAFRVTVIAARDDGRWRLAGIALSQLVEAAASAPIP